MTKFFTHIHFLYLCIMMLHKWANIFCILIFAVTLCVLVQEIFCTHLLCFMFQLFCEIITSELEQILN